MNSLGDTGWLATIVARVSTIERPDGEVLTYHHRLEPGLRQCDAQFNCVFVPPGGRVQSVTSNLGYQLKAGYAANTWHTDGTSNSEFSRLTEVTAINNAVDYCDPAADTCAGLTQSWPELTLGVSTSGSTTTRTFTDALGNAVTTTETSGRVTSVTSPEDAAADLNITYDASNRVDTLTRGGGTWDYGYSDSGSTRTTTVAQPLGGTRTYVSDLNLDRVTSVTDELGRTTSFQYDSFGRVTRVTAPEGQSVSYTYDSRGNVTATRRREEGDTGDTGDDIVTSASFPSTCSNPVTCNLPTSATDARGNTTDFTYDSTHGGVLTVTAPAPTSGATRPQVRYSYAQRSAWYKNSAGSIDQAPSAVYRVTAISACQTGSSPSCLGTADEVKTTIDYGTGSSSQANSLWIRSVSSGSGNGSLTATSAMAYDSVGNLTSVDGPLAGTADTSGMRYDALRRPTITVSPDPDGAGPLPHRARRVLYNDDGNAVRIEPGTATTLTGTFSPALTEARLEYGYDSLGRRVSERVASGFEPPFGSGTTVHTLTQTSYDSRGRLECTAQRMNPAEFGSPPASACTLDTEGSFGPDRVARNVYDNANQVTQVQVAYGTSAQANEASATYTDNGQVETLTDAEGNMTTYEYDVHDRLVKTRMPSPTTDGVSSTTDYEQLTLDANGNVTNLRLRDGQNIAFTFDALNRVTNKNLPGSEPDVTYTYDLLGRMTGASQTGHALTFTFDALGRNLTQVSPLGTVSYQYDLAGRRTRLTYPGSGLYVDYDYLVTGDVTKIRENGATSGVGVLATYAYDDLGRRTSLTRGNGTVTTYGFDATSRLDELVQNLSGTTSDLTLGFSHNPASQIVSNTRSNDSFSYTGLANQNVTDTINGLNQVTATGGTSVSHDSRGNVSAIGSSSYGYSSENLLISASGGVTLAYDPLTRLYQTSGAATTRFLYDGVSMIAEYDGSNTLQRRFVHGAGIDEPLVWYEGTGTSTRRWFHADERGSIVAVSDASGNVVGTRNRYDEYGNVQGTLTGRFGYTGQAWIPEAGLWYYRARMYNPNTSQGGGRFMQTDPIGYGSGMNLYAYVGNDPVNSTDPTGLRQSCDNPSTPDIEVCGKRPKRRLTPLSWWDIYGLGGMRGLAQLGNSITRRPGERIVRERTASEICDTPLADGSTIRENVRTIELLLEGERDSAGWSNTEQAAVGAGTFGFWLSRVFKGRWAGRLGEPWGNWNYGATGRAVGLSLQVLLRGAGLAEQLERFTGSTGSGEPGEGSPFGDPPYGDTPWGQEEIRQGYNAGCD